MFEKIGFTSVTFRKLSVDKIVDIAKANDIDYVEWGGDVHIKLESNMQSSISIFKTANKINCSSYGSYYVVGENSLSKFKTLCYIASQLGASIIRVWLGNKGSDKTSVAEVMAYSQEVNAMADIAMQANLTIAFEFHKNTYNDSAQSCLSFIKSINRDNVRTYWQPLGNYEQDLKILTDICYYVVGVHVFNWTPKGVRKPLKRGAKVWEEYFNLLMERHLNPIIIMEFVKNDSVRQFKKDVVALRKVLEKFKNE